MADESITVVVPTYRRPSGLARLLGALTGQDDPGAPWDVVVVDNDDAPGAQPVFDAASTALPVPARLVREHQRGASAARNRGFAEATGTIVVFVDDDVVPTADWLARLVEPILAGRCDGTGGRVLLDPAVPRPAWFDEPLADYLANHTPADRERPVEHGEYVITASAAFRSDLFRATGGFDTALGPRPGAQIVNDDVLVGDRFIAVGGRLHHAPGSVVVHELPPERLRPRYLIRRAHAQGRSDWRYLVRTVGRREALRSQVRWLRHEAGARVRERPWRRRVAFHAATDLARVAGAGRELLAGGWRPPPERAGR
jgi:glycosyltransferase involved in cell wall biosynthesis